MAGRKKTAETVSETQKLDHLMMLMTFQITKSGSSPTASMVKRAIKQRESIYELIDEVNAPPDLEFEDMKPKKMLNRRTGKSE